MNLLWITDPWTTLDHARDTTLRLIEEARRYGAKSWICDTAALRLDDGDVRARCRLVESVPKDRGEQGWGFGRTEDLAVSHFDLVHYRVDPPVDRRYWEPLQLLRLAEAAGTPTRIVNPPSVLVLVSEKLGPAPLVGYLPPTVVASAWEDLEAFGVGQQRTVLKPLGDAQSRAVRLLDWTTRDELERTRSLLEEATGGFRRPVVLQRFLDEVVAQGEKRLWFAEGTLVGHVRKRPAPGKFVIDMDRGATCEPCTLTPAEAELAKAIGRALRTANVSLAAVDVIAGFITDANVTSPGLVPLMEEALDENLAGAILDQVFLRHELQTG